MARKGTSRRKPARRRPAPSIAQRLQRLEEALLFSQREHEVLGEQVASLQRQVQTLIERLARLDVAIQHAAARSPASDAPTPEPTNPTAPPDPSHPI